MSKHIIQPNKYDVPMPFVFLLVLVMSALTFVLGMSFGNDWSQKSAIKAGVGQYDSKTGAFGWITPAKSEKP